MSINRVVIIGTDPIFRNLSDSSGSKLISAGVVMIVLGQDAPTVVYRLKEEELVYQENRKVYEQKFTPIHKDAFVLVGVVKGEVDKRNRKIYLANGDVVAYTQLIVASGSKQHFLADIQGSDFSTALFSFIEAVKVQKKVPFQIGSQQPPQPHQEKKIFRSLETPVPAKDIGKLAKEKIPSKEFDLALGGVDFHFVCEFQV